MKKIFENIKGLSDEEAEQRKKEGKINGDGSVPTKSVKEIIRTNLFTFFNLINVVLAALVFAVGSPRNALFMGVIVCNCLIGIIQEIRAKRIIDKLSLISAPKAKVVRSGEEREIAVSEIVLDDIMRLSAGMQVCADAEVVAGECEVNESLVTGESDPQPKIKGSPLLSGSFIICGEAYARAVKVGEDNFSNKITNGAKYLKKPNSEMLRSINKILKFITVCIVPIALILFYKSIFITGEPMQTSVISVVAAIIGMIPEGLVLLVSMVLAVSSIRLSKHNTLVQDLYCVETLARVDVLCLDKTGTITEGRMRAEEILPLSEDVNLKEIEIYTALGALTGVLPDDNPTANAVRERCSKYLSEDVSKEWICAAAFPFSSAKKWSGVQFEKQGSYVMGAAEFILEEFSEEIKQKIERYGEMGKRVVLLAHSEKPFSESKQLPPDLVPIALIIIGDLIRAEAKSTLDFFAEQNVEIKIISGDNPLTVKSVAQAAGVRNADCYIDMSSVTDERISEVAIKYTVFGRVTPEQKLKLVKALKENGHTVGMTGDGVNDVLALKEADCSIAMQSGSDAARNVSSLVLMDSNFASMPLVVAEGRRSINNIERSATLFLTKTVYSFLLAVIFLFVTKPYPFLPIQMTLNGLFIGIPSFFLAIEPNTSLVKGRFISNVMKKAVPLGLCVVLNISLLTGISHVLLMSADEVRTLATFILGFTSFAVLCYICKPFDWKRVFMAAVLAGLFSLAFIFFEGFFSITDFSRDMIITGAFLSGLTVITIPASIKLADILTEKLNTHFERKNNKA